jgi:hypothetical protein
MTLSQGPRKAPWDYTKSNSRSAKSNKDQGPQPLPWGDHGPSLTAESAAANGTVEGAHQYLIVMQKFDATLAPALTPLKPLSAHSGLSGLALPEQ